MMTQPIDLMTKEMHAVLAFAHDFAETHSLHFVTPEILMLGILEQTDPHTTSTLKALQFPVGEIKAKIIECMPPLATSRTGNIALTPRSQDILNLAAAEAQRRGCVYTGTEHLLFSLMDNRAGLPSRLAAKADLTQEKAEPILHELYPVSQVKQKQEHERREQGAAMMADWQKLHQTETGGTPHIPSWFLWSVRCIFLALLGFILFLVLFRSKGSIVQDLWMILFMGGLSFMMWNIGVPRKLRQSARRLRDWENPAIAGILCDMLTWSDPVIKREAQTGLIQLLPKMDSVSLRNLRTTHGTHLCRLLTPKNAEQNPNLVLAILGAFEQIGTAEEKSAVQAMAELHGNSPRILRVREAAQNCLDTIELRLQKQNQQQTLLRASASTPTENLLRPSISPNDTDPNELLRPTDSSEPSE